VRAADLEGNGRFASSAPTRPTRARIIDAPETDTVVAELPAVLVELYLRKPEGAARGRFGRLRVRETAHPSLDAQ